PGLGRVGCGRDQDGLQPTLRVRRDQPAADAGGPSILIVEPREHTTPLRLLRAGADLVQERVAEVGRLEAGTGVKVETAVAHLLKLADLSEKLRTFEPVVPRPERCATINRAGLAELRLGKPGVMMRWIQGRKVVGAHEAFC